MVYAAHTKLLIDNHDCKGEGQTLHIVNPATEQTVVQFHGASLAQVDQAVACARQAFEHSAWRHDAVLRRDVLRRLADLIEEQRVLLMDDLIEEIGTPIQLMFNQVDNPARFVRWLADAATTDRTRHLGFHPTHAAVSTLAYRPVGVVAAITAFNYPILLGITKIATALAAGCTTVLLSSPQAPLAILRMGDLIRRAGFPPGVVNILAGGADVGRALTEHHDIDKVSFTGSVHVGRQVMQQAAAGLHSAVLELGGKSAAILLPDADLRKYVYSLHARYARHAGQGCGSPTRILVDAAHYDEFIALSREIYPRLKVGDPRDPATVLGPVINAAQRERIEANVARALDAGAQIVAGGGRPDIPKGWFLNPALIGNLDNQADIAREELFGPIAVVLTYRSLEEAVRIANDSDLGLKAYVFGDVTACLKLAPQLYVGTVQINGGSPIRPDAPLTGYKHSGVGSEWGEDGIREFLRPQHIDCALN